MMHSPLPPAPILSSPPHVSPQHIAPEILAAQLLSVPFSSPTPSSLSSPSLSPSPLQSLSAPTSISSSGFDDIPLKDIPPPPPSHDLSDGEDPSHKLPTDTTSPDPHAIYSISDLHPYDHPEDIEGHPKTSILPGAHVVAESMGWQHYFYLSFNGGIIAALLVFVLNFAAAYILFWQLKEVPLFSTTQLCLCLDVPFTVIVQSYWTWIINGAVTCRDVRVGRSLIAPVSRVRPADWIDTPLLNEYFVCVDILRNDDVSGPFDYLSLFCGNSAYRKRECTLFFWRFLHASRNALLYVLVCFVLFVPLIVCTLIFLGWQGFVFTGPRSVLVKATYNGLLGLFQTPIVCYAAFNSDLRSPHLHQYFLS